MGYNFAEHLVLNTFYRGLVLVINIALFPFLFISQDRGSESLRNYALIVQNFDFILMYWCYAQFFNNVSKIRTFGLTLLTYLFMSTLNLVIGYVAGWIVSALS
jgi:hypothetical protein